MRPMKVDKSVKESGDTARLHKKFERKLSGLVNKVTPPDMVDTMQDVIIESSRILSEYFVSRNYRELVRVALISEMQKRGNEILIEVDGSAETFFFAAQRLKKTNSLEVAEPCSQVAYSLTKKLEDMIRCRSMARKLTVSMKDHIKEASDYLSAYVTKADEHIEAYVALLNEMEAAGNTLLIDGDIPKSYKDSADYLRQLTSFRDEISLPDSSLQSTTERNLKRLMATVTPRGYSQSVMSGAPIVTTEMSDWHAMMVSLMWNVQAWRAWIQENINRALTFTRSDSGTPASSEVETWTTFQRRVTTEALQWRQYNNFSRQLTLRLALRYRDKKIVSPTRATVKTEMYKECQDEMLDIIDMFNRWTRWLTVVIKETDSIPLRTDSKVPAYELRWNYFKNKVEEYLEDWNKYNTHLRVCWEQKYKSLISDWIPTTSWAASGPVWVVSACGAVPSGALAAGVYEGEVIWVARTTHRGTVLPAALHPSKHCCIVYSDGAVHHYTKYQVICNADVSWVACRAAGLATAGATGARAVRVARGVHVGRVHYRGSHLVGAVHAPAYRCHVVIFGRPFAFNCYELLVLSQDEG